MAARICDHKHKDLEKIILETNTSALSGEKLFKAGEILDHQIKTILDDQKNQYTALIKNHDAISENWKQKLSDRILKIEQTH